MRTAIRDKTKTVTYMADTKRAAAHRRPGPERGVAAYRRTPEREQTTFYPNHLLVIGDNEARPQYLQ